MENMDRALRPLTLGSCRFVSKPLGRESREVPPTGEEVHLISWGPQSCSQPLSVVRRKNMNSILTTSRRKQLQIPQDSFFQCSMTKTAVWWQNTAQGKPFCWGEEHVFQVCLLNAQLDSKVNSRIRSKLDSMPHNFSQGVIFWVQELCVSN